ncbi:HAD-IB family hydrolase [Phenylobacterium sp. LjRoot225]|uniref:HAD-IB family hydrolase n=1 Tax=Phenylobacterium sp. LjRoot225 TaxID=3342285 RepID=UPI003ECD0CB8
MDERPIAAFDFDGTLTVRDSFTAFLQWRAGPTRYALGMASLIPAAIRYLIDRDRGRIKAAAAREFLAGLPRRELEGLAAEFAAQQAQALFRPDALATWRDWGERGARRVIVTASPAVVVRPFAERLQADELIGTEMAYDSQDRVSGGFATANCRGREKVARLEARFGQGLRLAAAYGDTAGDREMLAIAETQGFCVFTGRPDRT